MIQFSALDTQESWDWFKERTHVIQCEDSQGMVAYSATGKILAVMVADNFSPDSCNVHVAIDSPIVIKHGFLVEAFHHLFNVCNRKHVFGLVPSNNAKALKFDRHIGFKESCCIPDGCGTGTDCIILRMDKVSCPWLDKIKEEVAA
jgi:hypothetical protein